MAPSPASRLNEKKKSKISSQTHILTSGAGSDCALETTGAKKPATSQLCDTVRAPAAGSPALSSAPLNYKAFGKGQTD